jgi:hypothetical protein
VTPAPRPDSAADRASGHPSPAVRLFIGGDPARIRGESVVLHGDRCFTAAAGRIRQRLDPARLRVLLDSGAFSDAPARRLTPQGALERQLRWETLASATWSGPCRAHALVSYDRLIDEKWDGGVRWKERWTAREADAAVRETVEAARHLAAQRARLAPRRLVLACQGVDAAQYAECVAGVLEVARPGDWLGLGGWCVLGRWQRRWLPAFWATLHAVLPRIAARGVGHVHVFGVLWLPALGGLVWLADRHGLTVSADSSAPLLAATWPDARKAGLRTAGWRANVAWWRRTLAGLRATAHYRRPPSIGATWRQPPLPLVSSKPVAQSGLPRAVLNTPPAGLLTACPPAP